jgi:hypothetical protein
MFHSTDAVNQTATLAINDNATDSPQVQIGRNGFAAVVSAATANDAAAAGYFDQTTEESVD